MSDWLMRVIKAEAARLIELAADDDELRGDLRELAESILAATAPTSPAAGADLLGIATAEVAQSRCAEPDESLRELTLGRSPSPKKDLRRRWRRYDCLESPHDDLVQLERRCRQKAETTHWAAERLRRAREGNQFAIDNAPVDPEMVAWGERLMDGFYFMQSSEESPPVEPAVVDNVGGCFEAVAEALATRSK